MKVSISLTGKTDNIYSQMYLQGQLTVHESILPIQVDQEPFSPVLALHL
jgi:hypothetical protein